jgi:hypothetical protein
MRSVPLVATVLVACTPQAPATPSFQQDVLPILAASCVRCHGYPVIGGAPDEFRLDTFEDTLVRAGTPNPGCGPDLANPDAEVIICGAATYAQTIPFRIRDEARPMPPRFPLDDYQIETLENWARDPVRGEPRPGNRVPAVTIEAIEQAERVIHLRTRVLDDDRDLVVGSLRARIGDQALLVGPVRSGLVELAWDVAGLPPGDHPLEAHVDDGAQVHILSLGQITITASSTAPSARPPRELRTIGGRP